MDEPELVHLDAPPDGGSLKPGQFGVNIPMLERIAALPITFKGQTTTWESFAKWVVTHPRPDGKVRPVKEVEKHAQIINFRTPEYLRLLSEHGATFLLNLNGLYAYNPELLILRDRSGVIRTYDDHQPAARKPRRSGRE